MKNYESMNYFDDDFPNSKNVRICQKGAYNACVDRLLYEKELSASAFLPTGTGKSDVVRALAIGLCGKRKAFCGAWVFSPSDDLKKQVAQDDTDKFFDRIGQTYPICPFMFINSLENGRFRNLEPGLDVLLESFTTQFLIAKDSNQKPNWQDFLYHADLLRRKTGKYPVAIFDESHLFSTDNEWGNAACQMQKFGIPIVLITGTPYRSDLCNIPGFHLTKISETESPFVKNLKTDDPLVIEVIKGRKKSCKHRLNADYEYSYQRAWADKVILKPQPIWVDATVTTYDRCLSEVSKGNADRLLRNFLMHDETIAESVKETISSIRLQKRADYSCGAIITTLSDEIDEEFVDSDEYDKYADIHAHKIEREVKRQAPDLKTIVVTSKTNCDGLVKFRNSDEYDVLIVKAMGTIGFNAPRIKTVLNLSNYRTLPGFTQLANRGCRNFAGIKPRFDLIMPADPGMKQLWLDFENETGLVVENVEYVTDSTDSKTVEEQDQEDKPKFDFTDYETYHDINSGRSKADETLDLLKRKIPELALSDNENQHLLNVYQRLSLGIGDENWLQKMPDPEMIVIKKPMLDANEEESRLRGEANDIQKLICKEILSLTKRKYEKSLYGDISTKVWTCLKRRDFGPRQSLEKISGIVNFKKVVAQGNLLLKKVQALPEDPNFDYKSFLSVAL